MKITLEWPLKTLSGKDLAKGVVYLSCKNGSQCIMRRYVKPRTTAHNHLYGSKFSRACMLYKEINPEFVNELRRYADAYGKQLCAEKKLPPNQYNIFKKALINGKVGLADLDSLEGFVGIFGNTIEEWIAHGLLPKVKAKFAGIEVCLGFRGQVLGVRETDVCEPASVVGTPISELEEVCLGFRGQVLGVREADVCEPASVVGTPIDKPTEVRISQDRWQMTGDRDADVCEPALTVETPITASEPLKGPKPTPKTVKTARQAWRNRPKTQTTTMYMRNLLTDSGQYIIPMPKIMISNYKDLTQLKEISTQKADDG